MLAVRNNEEDRSGIELPSSSPAPHIPDYNAGSRKASELKPTSTVAHGNVTYFIKDKHRITLTGHVAKLERGGEFSPWTQISYGVDDAGSSRGTVIALYRSMVGLNVALKPIEPLSLDGKIAYFNGAPTDEDRLDVGSDVYYVRRDFGYDSLETGLEGRWQIIEDLDTVIGAEFIYDWENKPSSLRLIRFAMDDFSPGDIIESSSTPPGNGGALQHRRVCPGYLVGPQTLSESDGRYPLR